MKDCYHDPQDLSETTNPPQFSKTTNDIESYRKMNRLLLNTDDLSNFMSTLSSSTTSILNLKISYLYHLQGLLNHMGV